MKKILLSAALITFIPAAFATVNNTLDAAGIFVGGGLGYAFFDANNANLPSSDLRGFSWNMSAGYQFNPYIALEGAYTAFDHIKIAFNGGAIDNNAYGLSLLAKGIMPIKNNWNIFGKLGLMRLHSRSAPNGYGQGSDVQYYDKYVPQLGLGGSYIFNDNLSATLQGLYSFASTNGVPATTGIYAGLNYLFTI